VVSALLGSYDDAVCVVIAVAIVLTGKSRLALSERPIFRVVADEQSPSCKSKGPKNH
jgi:hypothetical protein